MVFDKLKKAWFEICKTWTRPEIQKGVSAYYDNFEENKAKHIKSELQGVKNAIDSLNQRAEALKKDIKKDKDKQKTLNEVRDSLEKKKAALEQKNKDLKNLPQQVKQLKDDFSKQLKELMKAIDDVLKIRGEIKEENLPVFTALIEKFRQVDKIVSLSEIIKQSGVEFKVDTEFGPRTFKDFTRMVLILHASVVANVAGLAFEETLPSKHAALLARAHDMSRQVLDTARKEKIDVEQHEDLHAFITGNLVMAKAIHATQDHDYIPATRFFLKARELLEGIKGDLGLGGFVQERAAVAKASASDAFNVPYLLNSHAHWNAVAKQTKDAETREIATMSVKNIEEWVTKQYGFPSEAKQKAILRDLIWPRAEFPPDVADPSTRKPAPGARGS